MISRFDERISHFAEQKFQRDGIEVKTGCRVMEIQKKVIVMQEKSTGKRIEVPYGMVVWSTGIGTRPVISDFMNQIGQVRVQLNFEWLWGIGKWQQQWKQKHKWQKSRVLGSSQ